MYCCCVYAAAHMFRHHIRTADWSAFTNTRREGGEVRGTGRTGTETVLYVSMVHVVLTQQRCTATSRSPPKEKKVFFLFFLLGVQSRLLFYSFSS